MEDTQTKKNISNRLEDIFNQTILPLNEPEYITDIRKKAFSRFKKTGIPDSQNEKYRHTHLEPLFSGEYKTSGIPEEIQVEMKEIFQCDIPELDTYLVFLINGFYYSQQNVPDDLPEGVIIGSFMEACRTYPDRIKKYFSKQTNPDEDGLIALNTALARDGFFIYIPDGVVMEKPVQVINMLLSEEDRMVQQRNLVYVGINSQCRIVICDHTLSMPRFLTNSVTEIYVSKNARLEYYHIQNEHNLSSHISSVYFSQKANSSVLSNILSLHGGVIRNNLHAVMEEPGCENNMYGLFFSDKSQHVDNYTLIEHAGQNCTSKELFKGILDDSATGVFNGRIKVWRGAQKTVAYQANNNILLSEKAKMNTNPQLEIYADDVKCSHGATVGQLDRDALFYLRSRGISEKEAILLLMYAFSHEIIKQIRIEPLQERYMDMVDKRLRGELSRCNHCAFRCQQADRI